MERSDEAAPIIRTNGLLATGEVYSYPFKPVNLVRTVHANTRVRGHTRFVVARISSKYDNAKIQSSI